MDTPTKMTIEISERHTETLVREGNEVITNKHLKKQKRTIHTENARCDYCDWRCKSANMSEAKIKMRLHKKICHK